MTDDWSWMIDDWYEKRVKKLSRIKVSNGLRQLPSVYQVFPMVSKDPRGSSKVAEGSQTVSPTLHTCQEKSDHSVARKNWWLMSAD